MGAKNSSDNEAKSSPAKPKNNKKELRKIKIFQTAQKQLATLGICPELVSQAHLYNGRTLTVYFLLGTSTISNFVYIFHGAQSFGEYTQSSYTCSMCLSIFVDLLVLIPKAEKLFEIINDCEVLTNTKFKYCGTHSILNETNQLVEKVSQFVYWFVLMSVSCVLLSWLLFTYFIFFTTGSGVNAFQLPAPMWFPFDWKTPFGFLLASAIQLIWIMTALSLCATLISLVIGIYLLSDSYCKCIKKSILEISKSTKNKANQQRIFDQIVEFNVLHSRVTQLFCDLSEVAQGILTAQCSWSLVTICGALLLVQIQIIDHGNDLLTLMLTLNEGCYSFGFLCITCEIGQRIKKAFEECSDKVDRLKWYSFPLEIQRMMPLIIHFTQQPIEIKCFGSVSANRETCKYVVKTAWSYFTVLRQFYN